MTEKMPKALYRGELPIGNTILDCFVLDDDDKNPSRILSAKAVFGAFDRPRKGMNSRLEIDGTKLPPFIAAGNLKPLITQDIIGWTKLIEFIDTDGKHRTGYKAGLLPILCDLYLQAQNKGILIESQSKIADKARILLSAFAEVGITALVDEATGFQYSREYNALRVLLQIYLKDKAGPWLKEYPDDIFFQLDRLYGNEKMPAGQRPLYYGKFINTYIYEPLENGKINEELQKRYKGDGKKHKKHTWFTDEGKQQLRLQIGRVLGLMEISPNLRWFKEKQSRQGQLVLFPDLE
jgi:hypothetical protein